MRFTLVFGFATFQKNSCALVAIRRAACVHIENTPGQREVKGYSAKLEVLGLPWKAN